MWLTAFATADRGPPTAVSSSAVRRRRSAVGTCNLPFATRNSSLATRHSGFAEEAIRAYANGEVDLSAAARHAGISVYQMMTELQRRDITPRAAREKFLDGLETLAETFGGSEALFR